MGFFWRWVERLKSLVLPGRQDAQARSEMQFHIDMEIRDGIARGLSPDEARRKALRDFGGMERYREQAREVRWASFLHDVVRDLRFAVRALASRPSYTAIVLVTLAVGVGATTALFTVVNGVLLRPLPYPQPDDVIRIQNSWTGSPRASLSPAEFVDLEEWLDDFASVGAYVFGGQTLTGDGPAERVSAGFASAGVWDALGIAPALGRVYTTEEDRAGINVAVITDGFWRSRFGADAGVLGTSVQMSGRTTEIIGVLPPEFRMPEDLTSPDRVQLVLPLAIDPTDVDQGQRGSHFLTGVARLGAGMSLEDGDRRLSEAGARMVSLYPNEYPTDMGFRTNGVPLLDDLVGPVRPMLLLLMGAVALAFTIVCANVANLLLTRVAGRAPELALRKAMGASRGRIVGQVLVESLVLAACGGLLGILVATGATRVLIRFMPQTIPRVEDIAVSGSVLGFGLTVSVLSGLLFGALPALYAGRGDIAKTLKSGARDSGPAGGQRLRRWLVTGQVALAVVLSAGAALVTRSFIELTSVDPGFRTENVVAAQVSLPSARYSDEQEVIQFFEEFMEELRAVPGVIEVGAVTNLPLATRLGDMSFELEEERIPEGRNKPDADWQVTTPGYFETLDLAVLAGRGIDQTDRTDSRGVVVINRTMAEQHWNGQDPIGRRIRLGGQMTEPRWAEVVGIVDDVSHLSLDQPARPQMYFSHAQFRFWSTGQPTRALTVVAQSQLAAADLQRLMRLRLEERDPELALYGLATLAEARGRSVARPRFTSMLLGGFSGVALALALVGVYGVMMFAVRQRTREFGVRIALGAAPGWVVNDVLRDASKIAFVGVGIGLIAALGLSRLLEGFLYNVTPTDPTSLALTVVGVLAAAVLASYWPARQASRADPISALRGD
ncbi:MAG: ADOP family duplicated permease [Longimicrobiales bacterium]